MAESHDTIAKQLEELDMGLAVLEQHVDIIDRKIDTLCARFERLERQLDRLTDPIGASGSAAGRP